MTKGYQLCHSGGRRHGGGMETHLRESLDCRDHGCGGDPEMCRGRRRPLCRGGGLGAGGRGGCCCAVSPAWCIYLQGGSRRGVGCDGASTGSVARSPRDAEAAVAGLIVIPWENCKMSPIVLATPFYENCINVLKPLKNEVGVRNIWHLSEKQMQQALKCHV